MTRAQPTHPTLEDWALRERDRGHENQEPGSGRLPAQLTYRLVTGAKGPSNGSLFGFGFYGPLSCWFSWPGAPAFLEILRYQLFFS